MNVSCRDRTRLGEEGCHHRINVRAREGELPALFEELMLRHYDPHYERSQSNHFEQWPRRQILETDQLSDEAIAGLAQQIIAMQAR